MEDVDCWSLKFTDCIYSKKLINKLLCINKKINRANKTLGKKNIDIGLIKKSIYYAKKYHGSQRRIAGEPYYSHPIEVAYMVSNFCFKSEILATAILHDTIEDTALTKDMLAVIFNEEIANNVEDLTRVKSQAKLSSIEIIKNLWNKGKQDLLLVKYFDRLHNIFTINVKSPEKIHQTIQETLNQFISLSIHFKSTIPGFKNQKLLRLCLHNLAQNNLQALQI